MFLIELFCVSPFHAFTPEVLELLTESYCIILTLVQASIDMDHDHIVEPFVKNEIYLSDLAFLSEMDLKALGLKVTFTFSLSRAYFAFNPGHFVFQ